MLFQRLYNWIKYKTLPPSFLFKNRLFIERDSKHRRILSNFGLSFRNSKWSNYEVYNIKNQFKTSYYKFISFLFIFFILVFILINFNKYYISFFFFNNVSFLFWISVDTFDYYLSFLVWFATIGSSMFLNLLYSYLFFNNFSSKVHPQKIFSNNFLNSINPPSSRSSKDNFVSKHDLNLVLYSWLTNSTFSKNLNVIENLFNVNVNNKIWTEFYDFFIKLYKVVFYLNLTTNDLNSFALNQKLNKIDNKTFMGDKKSLINYFNNSKLLNNHSSLLFWYILNNYNTYFDSKNSNNSNLKTLNNRFEWNLHNFTNETNKYPFLIKSKVGFFFLNDFNYSKLSHFLFNFEELWSLNFYLKNQLDVSKWNRWLYRYSILHRKVLKNSHKITLAKRLINSGVYDSKFFDKNIWNSQYLNKYVNTSSTSSLFNLFYKNQHVGDNNVAPVSHKIHVLGNSSLTNGFDLLNFYENSYFWFLKRFYSFNTLSSNSMLSKNKIKNYKDSCLNEILASKENSFNKHNILFSYLLKSSHLNSKDLNYLESIDFTNNILFESKDIFNDNSSFNTKDLYLLLNDNDLLTKDNLNTFFWVSSNSTKNNNLLFFNYLSSTNRINKKIYSTFISHSNSSSHLLFPLFTTSFNIDKIYLNDLTYLSLFY